MLFSIASTEGHYKDLHSEIDIDEMESWQQEIVAFYTIDVRDGLLSQANAFKAMQLLAAKPDCGRIFLQSI